MSQILSEGIVDLFVIYKILKQLVTPFEKWKAFQVDLIDDKGNILVPKNKRTSEQKKSFTKFHLFILKLKKMLAVIPEGKTKIASYAAALWFLKEEKHLNSWTEKEAINFITENFEAELNALLYEEQNKLKRITTLVESSYKNYFTNHNTRTIGEKAGIDFTNIDLRTFKKALQMELMLRDDFNPCLPIEQVPNIEKIALSIIENLKDDPEYYVEEVPANNIGSGNIAMYDPVIKFAKRDRHKKKKSLQNEE
jgi:hypothetical protein